LSESSKSPENEQKNAGSRWPLFVGLPLIVLVAVAAVLFSGGGQERPSGTAERPEGARSGGEEASGDGPGLGTPALGSADAPVVMTEYGDFQ
jgi:hypothetical protein